MIVKHVCALLLLPVSFCIPDLCLSDSSCPVGMQCTPVTSGYSICMRTSKGIQRKYPSPPSFYCKTDRDCARTQVCARRKGEVGNCLDAKSGGAGLPCHRNSDCSDNLQCVDYHGQWQCLKVDDMLKCSPTSTCKNGEDCIYSETEKRMVCTDADEAFQGKATLSGDKDEVIFAKSSDDNEDNLLTENNQPVTLLPYVSWKMVNTSSTRHAPSSRLEANGTSHKEEATVMETKYSEMPGLQPIPKHALIDPAALPCEFDYQCRMGESCSGTVALVDRVVTVCQYDVTKKDRQCIYHADCLQGQQCLRNESDIFVCTTSMEAALGTAPCTYDYECSGGEKCVSLIQAGEKVFRCRPSQVKDPRRDQICRNNAECPYQQVCRRVAAMSLCVDVMSSTDPTAVLSVQRKIVTFIQNLLFSK